MFLGSRHSSILMAMRAWCVCCAMLHPNFELGTQQDTCSFQTAAAHPLGQHRPYNSDENLFFFHEQTFPPRAVCPVGERGQPPNIQAQHHDGHHHRVAAMDATLSAFAGLAIIQGKHSDTFTTIQTSLSRGGRQPSTTTTTTSLQAPAAAAVCKLHLLQEQR